MRKCAGTPFKHLALLCVAAGMVLIASRAATADVVYSVTGTFGTSTTYTGPLNGAHYSGTFSAPLPIAITGPICCTQDISTFDINLISSSGVTLATLSSSTSPLGSAYFSVDTGTTCVGGPPGAGCDLLSFTGGLTFPPSFLQLVVPLDFTGGNVYPFLPVSGAPSIAGFAGADPNDLSVVSSGVISPVPEPSSLSLLGVGLLAGLGLGVRRLVDSSGIGPL